VVVSAPPWLYEVIGPRPCGRSRTVPPEATSTKRHGADTASGSAALFRKIIEKKAAIAMAGSGICTEGARSERPDPAQNKANGATDNFTNPHFRLADLVEIIEKKAAIATPRNPENRRGNVWC
jgi:hypothetical protein